VPSLEFGVTVTIPHETLRDLARDQLAGREMALRDGVAIRVDDIELAPRGDRLAATLQFAVTRLKKLPLKPAGRLVVVGDPRVDPATRRLVIGDLALDVESGHLLLKATDRVLHRTLLSALESALDIPLDGPLRRTEAFLNEKLRDLRLGDRGRMTWTVTELRPRAITVTPGDLEATVDVLGHGDLQLELSARG